MTSFPRSEWSRLLVCYFNNMTNSTNIDTMSWEGLAADRTEWRSALKQHLETGEEKLMTAAADNERAERRAAAPSDPKPHIYVMSAIKTAIHALVFSAISDATATQQEINKKLKTKNIRMYHPWSSLTDGGLYSMREPRETALLHVACGNPASRRYCMGAKFSCISSLHTYSYIQQSGRT